MRAEEDSAVFRVSSLLVLLLAFPANAKTYVLPQWRIIKDAGNAADTNGYGSVAYNYKIARFEVTNADYAVFLSAVAESDTHNLYNSYMGIDRLGFIGDYVYKPKPGRALEPVSNVSFWDAIRFANWLHNDQKSGAQNEDTTEDGAYKITADGITNNTIEREPGAFFFVPSVDEWYKAAYYDPASPGPFYNSYPTSSVFDPLCSGPSFLPNTANCASVLGFVTIRGAYPNSPSPYGTLDQGGNVLEWTEDITVSGDRRHVRGGYFDSPVSELASTSLANIPPATESDGVGFRIAARAHEPVPTSGPAAVLLLAAGLVMAFAYAQRRLSIGQPG